MSIIDGQAVVTVRRPARPVLSVTPPAPAVPAVIPAAMRDLRVLTWLPVGGLLGLLMLSLAAPAASARLALPVAVAGALVGLPHGSVDHLVPLWWSTSGTRTARRLAGFIAVYAAVAVAALGLFLMFPTPMLVVFLVLSAAHFGRGEVVTSAERAGRRPPASLAEWPATAAFGTAVVGLLLWAHPAAADPYLRPLSPWLAARATDDRGSGLLCVALVVAAGVVALLRDRRWQELAELLLLVVALSVCPPLAAFGVYFGLWHAVRHTGRLLDLARRGQKPSHTPSWRPAARRVGRASLLPTVAALSVIALLWFGRTLAGLQSEVAVLLALTFPHSAVVWALDRRDARQPRLNGRHRERTANG